MGNVSSKKITIPLTMGPDGLEWLNGLPIPGLQFGARAELVVDLASITDRDISRLMDEERVVELLPKDATLLAPLALRPGALKKEPLAQQLARYPARNDRSELDLVEIVLSEPLRLLLKPGRSAGLLDCKCKIPLLGNQEAGSINHAYTLASTEVERHRRSHTTDVFQTVYYAAPSGAWQPLGELRAHYEDIAENCLEFAVLGKAMGADDIGSRRQLALFDDEDRCTDFLQRHAAIVTTVVREHCALLPVFEALVRDSDLNGVEELIANTAAGLRESACGPRPDENDVMLAVAQSIKAVCAGLRRADVYQEPPLAEMLDWLVTVMAAVWRRVALQDQATRWGQEPTSEETLGAVADLKLARRRAEYSSALPERCDVCGTDLETERFFVDGALASGQWANMCPPCFAEHGAGIGYGVGQLYMRQADGEWLLVAGFPPEAA